MSDKPENPLAFPSDRYCDEGMNLRDYFAAAALQGLLAKYGADADVLGGTTDDNPEYKGCLARMAAKNCYEYADEMLKARLEEGV